MSILEYIYIIIWVNYIYLPAKTTNHISIKLCPHANLCGLQQAIGQKSFIVYADNFFGIKERIVEFTPVGRMPKVKRIG